MQPVSDTLSQPGEIYQQRLDRRRDSVLRLGNRERLIGNARVVAFLLGLLLAWLAFGSKVVSPFWVVLVFATFVVLLFVHDRVQRSWRRARRAVLFYEAGQARLEHVWMGQGRQGQKYVDETHPYAADLDLFGSGSLFELLCTARTQKGEDMLADWLKGPASPTEIRARQAAVEELRSELDLREDLALLGGEVPIGIDFDAVAQWGSAEPILTPLWWRWPAIALGLITVGCLFGWLLSLIDFLDVTSAFGGFFSRWGSLPFLCCGLLELIFGGWFRKPVDAVLRTVEKRSHDLAMLAKVLARLEQAHFSSPRLSELKAALGDIPQDDQHASTKKSALPSQQIAELGNLLELLNSRRNQFFAPFAFLLMWGTQMAHAIEAWRARWGKEVRGWIDVVGQFEALCAFATFAFENPEDPFPSISDDAVCYDARGLGHPLLPKDKCVRNDLHLTGDLRILVVSGSNMSGKSTFLRTVGINAVLALAGAPVRATSMHVSPLAIGATLRIQDSLQAGRSRFYAEILRVRQLVDLSRGELPLLFLLDEIFAGTNSHDRKHGADAVVQGLVEEGGIGLVTTHDLSLTAIADQLGPRADNVHFADHFENDEIHFDYKLRKGIVEKSNALALMRAVGLKV